MERDGPARNSLGRLPSLKAPRDLSLGGSGRGLLEPGRRGSVKRTFAPTIPAPKIKKERIETPAEAEVSTHNENSHGRDKHDRRGRGHDSRGRGQSRGQNVVYQKSIFEDYSKEKSQARQGGSGIGSYGYGGGGGGGGGSSLSRGASVGDSTSDVVKVKEEQMPEGDTEDIMKDLLRDNFIDNDKLATVDPSMFPVLLDPAPKTEFDSKSNDIKSTQHESSTSDVKIKEENVGVSKPKTAVPWKPISQWTTKEQVFCPLHDSKKLLLIHFPDLLPGFPSAKGVAGTSAQPKTAAANVSGQTNVEEKTLHSLKDFTEGFLGKMKVRRSGKVEFELGKITFEGIGLPSKMLQEVVVCDVGERSVISNPELSEGDMTVIGHINHKINFTPQIDSIIDAIAS